MNKVTKQFRFEAAHRLLNYQGKCANLHGHSYLVEITYGAESLVRDMVLDFDKISETIGQWIKNNLDHGMILNEADHSLIGLGQTEKQRMFCVSGNPTAERIAQLIHNVASTYKWHGVTVLSVTVHETQTCSATYSKE